jgi:hypothetical protein
VHFAYLAVLQVEEKKCIFYYEKKVTNIELQQQACLMSGFHHGVNGIFAFVGCYTVWIG